jgi:metalloendopeptidase OMA1, mitochondrial
LNNLPDLPYEIYVIPNDSVNAACLPGGKMFVFTGAMDKFKKDEELAVVLAHEIAHALARREGGGGGGGS